MSKGELKSQYDKETIVGSSDSSVIDQIVKQKNFPIKHQAPKLEWIWFSIECFDDLKSKCQYDS